MSASWSIFVTGSSGYLGHEVCAVLEERRLEFVALARSAGFDLLDSFAIPPHVDGHFRRALHRPLLIHLAAWSRQGACAREPECAFRANTEATAALASVVRAFDGRMVYTSTDLVFDGTDAPYSEEDEAAPLSTYGQSKLGGEGYVQSYVDGLVVRIPLLYGPSFDGSRGASDSLIQAAKSGRELRLFEDEWRTPLHVRTAAERIVDLALDSSVLGLRHLPGPERLSRLELGSRVLAESGIDAKPVAARRDELPGEPRPRDCSLDTLLA